MLSVNESTLSFIVRLFRWLKPLFVTGLKRSIEEDDICAVRNSMRCEQNTETYAKLWKVELTKSKPSILRVMLKVHVYKVIAVGILFTLIQVATK